VGERDEDAEHGADGDGRSSNDVLESAADCENCATASLCCSVSTHGGGDSEPNSDTSKLGDSAVGSAALLASSDATILVSIVFNSSIKANAPLTSVFALMGACTMATSIGGAHRDGDNGSSHDVLESVVEHEDCGTTRLPGERGTPHMGMATTRTQ
jgi:hypothetical protein